MLRTRSFRRWQCRGFIRQVCDEKMGGTRDYRQPSDRLVSSRFAISESYRFRIYMQLVDSWELIGIGFSWGSQIPCLPLFLFTVLIRLVLKMSYRTWYARKKQRKDCFKRKKMGINRVKVRSSKCPDSNLQVEVEGLPKFVLTIKGSKEETMRVLIETPC